MMAVLHGIFFSVSASEMSSLWISEAGSKYFSFGCFGATTAKAALEAGLRLDIEAPTPEAPSMTAALEQYLKKQLENDGPQNDE